MAFNGISNGRECRARSVCVCRFSPLHQSAGVRFLTYSSKSYDSPAGLYNMMVCNAERTFQPPAANPPADQPAYIPLCPGSWRGSVERLIHPAGRCVPRTVEARLSRSERQ